MSLDIYVRSFVRRSENFLDICPKICQNGTVAGNVTGNSTGNVAPNLHTEMKKSGKSVTIHDVAQAAGVSVSTVSRVLNEKDDVAPDTQDRVLAIISELGYTSSLAARSMRSRKKNLLGLVVPDIGSPYSIEIMKGINRAIAVSTFDLLVYTTGDVKKTGSISHEQHYVSLLSNSITDGVIIVASAASDFLTDVPIVSVDPHVINPSFPSVQGTNYQGSLELVQYLLALGHQRIGFIAGRPEIGSSGRRFQGYQDALTGAGIEMDEDLIVPGDFSAITGHKCALQILAIDNPPTAIFAANDQSAIGVYQAAEELGLQVPDDLSVVGFDNISETEYLGLTTVDQFLSEMGFIATNMLIKLVDNEPLDAQIHKVPTKLVKRDSCRSLLAGMFII